MRSFHHSIGHRSLLQHPGYLSQQGLSNRKAFRHARILPPCGRGGKQIFAPQSPRVGFAYVLGDGGEADVRILSDE
jgi:hypothetical protein